MNTESNKISMLKTTPFDKLRANGINQSFPKTHPPCHQAGNHSRPGSKNGLRFLCCLLAASISGVSLATHNMVTPDRSTLASAISTHLIEEPLQPLPAIPKLNPGKVALGQKLFFDTRLSADNNLSCASCHDLATNGADHLAHSRGYNNIPLAVNTPSVFNSALNPWQFWDGRAHSLEEQIDFVIKSPSEMANSWPVVIRRLKASPDYVREFSRLYAGGISRDNIRNAIATFERTLLTPGSRFDRWLLGDEQALDAKEKKGYRLFKDYGCATCHQGANIGGNLFQKIGIFADYFQHRDKIQPADYGRFNVSRREQDRYVFRVPSLRNVAVTAPYFHDGSVNTLHKAIQIIASYQLGRTIQDDDIQHIIAFLKTLTGKYKGRLLTPAAP